MKILKNNRAEGYIDSVVCVIAAMMVIVLALNAFSFLTLKQNMDYFAKEMIKQVSNKNSKMRWYNKII